MPAAEEIRGGLSENRELLRAAIADAEARWEQSPAPEAEGEESWSPRQVAEHVIGAERFFASRTAQTLEREGPETGELSLASAADALAALSEVSETADAVYATLSDADLEKDTGRGPLSGLLEIAVGHLANHAEQIRAASS